MKHYRYVITIVVIVLTSTGLFSYKRSLLAQLAQNSGNEPTATISAIHVTQSKYQKTTEVNGRSQARQTIQVINEVPGKIIRLNFSSGAVVSKGQILLELDHREESAELIAAQAKVKFKKKVLQRYTILHKSAKISDELVDKATMELSVSQSDVVILQATISKKIIRAPFASKAGIHNLQVGQYLEQNSQITPLIGIDATSWIDFYVPQVYSELKVGSQVTVSFGAPNPHSIQAMIVSMEPMLTDETRQVKYRARITTKKYALTHNRLVKVRLPIADQNLKISIPNLAVSKDALGDYVFMIKTDEQGIQRAHRQKVELGDRIGDNVIVNQGLTVADYIANAGAFKLRPGLKVSVAASEITQLGSL